MPPQPIAMYVTVIHSDGRMGTNAFGVGALAADASFLLLAVALLRLVVVPCLSSESPMRAGYPRYSAPC